MYYTLSLSFYSRKLPSFLLPIRSHVRLFDWFDCLCVHWKDNDLCENGPGYRKAPCNVRISALPQSVTWQSLHFASSEVPKLYPLFARTTSEMMESTELKVSLLQHIMIDLGTGNNNKVGNHPKQFTCLYQKRVCHSTWQISVSSYIFSVLRRESLSENQGENWRLWLVKMLCQVHHVIDEMSSKVSRAMFQIVQQGVLLRQDRKSTHSSVLQINWAMNDKQEFIDIAEVVYRGARKGRGLVVSPKGEPLRWPILYKGFHEQHLCLTNHHSVFPFLLKFAYWNSPKTVQLPQFLLSSISTNFACVCRLLHKIQILNANWQPRAASC